MPIAVPLQTARRDRRSPFGGLFLATFAGDPARPLSFDDLVRASADAECHYSDVVSWIATSMGSGLIEEAGYEADDAGLPRGPRRYRITAVGLERARHDRRRHR